MNDFAELENELRKLRPALASPFLFGRIEEAMDCMANGRRGDPARQPERSPHNWLSLGFGLAAAAVLVLFAVVKIQWQRERPQTIAKTSPTSETIPALNAIENSNSPSKFIPAGATQVVYNARDEGLHLPDGLERPVRRVRYQTQQTWRWRDRETGASLRVSYPTEDVVLIPVSGQ